MRQLFVHFFTLLMLCACHQAAAQAAFDPNSSVNTFTVGNASVFNGATLNVPSAGNTYSWSVYISKPTSDSQTQGQIAIYAGNSSSTLASNPVSSNSQTVFWSPSAVNGRNYVTVQGTCALNSTNLNGYNKLYAVFIPSPGSISMNRVVSTAIPVSINIPPSTSVPSITSISPSSGPAGSTVTITGTNLWDADGVAFTSGYFGTILSTSATSVSVRVPGLSSTGAVPVYVHNPLGNSNTLSFTITNYTPPASPCSGSGTAICSSQNVPFTSSPRPLQTQARPHSTYGCNSPSIVFEWEYSDTGKDDDWHRINGPRTSSFQPWACWQTVYYRSLTQLECSNYWGTTYHEDIGVSDAAIIIPYNNINPGVYQLRNRATQQSLEIGGGGYNTMADGAYANQWPYVGTANQQWEMIPTSNGMYKIVNRNSGQVLEIGGGPTPQPAGATANQWPYYGHLSQQWLFREVTYGSHQYYVVTNALTGQELEIPDGSQQPGARAGQWLANIGEEWAQWELVPVSVPTSTRFPATYNIENANSHMVLEIGGADTNNGAMAQQWTGGGLASQQWRIIDAGGGLFQIQNRNSALALDVEGVSAADGARVQQWSYGGGANQKWAIDYESATGTFKITSANSGKVLEISGFSTTAGGAAQQWSDVGALSQRWYINPVNANRTVASSQTLPGQPASTSQSESSSSTRLDEARSELFAYPNPARAELQLALANGKPIRSIIISDIRGVNVLKLDRLDNSRVNVSSLASGVYIVSVSDGKQEYHQRFNKE